MTYAESPVINITTTVLVRPWYLVWWCLKKGLELILYTLLSPARILKRWCYGERLAHTGNGLKKVIQSPDIEHLKYKIRTLVSDLRHTATIFNYLKISNERNRSEFHDGDTVVQESEKRLRSAHQAAHQELLNKIRHYEDRLKAMQNKNERLQNDNKAKDALVSQKDLKIIDLKNQLAVTTQESEQKDPLHELELDLKGLQKDVETKDELLNQKDAELQELENELENAQQNKEELQKLLQSFETEVKNFKTEISEAQDKLKVEVLKYETLENENRELRQRLNDIESELQVTKSQLNNSEAEKDDALKRLSEIMSLRLRDNNPNIVDLNDQYRPTKLAEMMNELYDNQWTDVFSYYEDNWNHETGFVDEKCIELLLNILMETYSFCQEKVVEEWNEGITKILWTADTDDDKELLKKLKDTRRKNALVALQSVNQECLQYLRVRTLSDDDDYPFDPSQNTMKLYIDECVRICWLMALQDPPVCFVCEGWTRRSIRDRKTTHRDNHGIKSTQASPSGKQGSVDECTEISNNANEFTATIYQDNHGTHTQSIDTIKLISATTDNEARTSVDQCDDSDAKTGATSKMEFDKDLYREYTRRGQYVEYIVWPCMYLHKGGPILNKGVAQGCNS